MTRLDEVKQMPRSVSQLKEYRDCPHRYYLHRVLRVWQRPAAWLPHGTAFHTAAERFEKSGRTMSLEEVQEVFRQEYATDTNALCEDTPRFDFWEWSGPYDGETDVERRWSVGQDMVERYYLYYRTGKGAAEYIWWIPDGTPAVELPFDVEIGGVRVRGFIDQVIYTEDSTKPRVRDLKSGALPGDAFQLATYAAALAVGYGAEVVTGDYWMAKTGKPTKPYDLTVWPTEAVGDEFAEMDAGVKAERFEPTSDPDKCRRCPVRDACKFSMS